jgi:methylamine dehydrogenase accessory protein MauD
MQAALPYIVVLQLLLTLGLAVLVFGLARQVGILHERVAPMGALASDQGLAVGEMSPHLPVTTLAGDRLVLGGASPHGRSRLLLFVSPTCPVCKKLLPIARSFAHAERLDILLIGDGDDAEQRSMIHEFGLEGLPYINSPQVVLLDAAGVIRAKGLVNNREHLESLLIAEETGFGTIQAYLDAKQRVATNGRDRPHEARF